MLKFGRTVVKKRIIILIIGLILLIPSAIGFLKTGVNYDVLLYLPDSMETVQGQDILLDEFNKGGFAMVMFKGMDDKDMEKCCQKIENIDHVDSVIAYDTLLGPQVPDIILPNEIKDVYEEGDTQLAAVFFDTPTSDVGSIEAIQAIRKECGKQCYVSGMSAFVTDLKEVSEHEEPIYVAIAVVLATLLMALLMDSAFVSVVFVLGIGMAIIFNMGSNLFLGEISYITKAIAAVLQLAVTMDYSIFLWHSYEEHRFEMGMNKKRPWQTQ